MITIRRIRIGEADLYRQIRLYALQDAPYAFSSTYDAALQRTAESWQEQADSTAGGSDRTTFIAFSENIPVGMAALYRRKDNIDQGELLQVWVSAEYRGKNIALALVDQVFNWAAENNFHRIITGVTNGNTRALGFYKKYGFAVPDHSSTYAAGNIWLVKEIKS
jgi:ribosomal protein S18 acetylase RimI-like enzyme